MITENYSKKEIPQKIPADYYNFTTPNQPFIKTVENIPDLCIKLREG